MAGSDLLVWLDMEMSGLDPAKERIIEMATIITDGQLTEIAVGPSLVVTGRLFHAGTVFVVDRPPVQAARLGLPMLVSHGGPDLFERVQVQLMLILAVGGCRGG